MLFSGFLFCVIILTYCANRKPTIRATYYNFDYDGEKYHIRSLASTDKALSRNEVIGKNFVAIDYDQDRFIDEIGLGEVSLANAQIIYEHALAALTMENKLQVVSPKISRYQYANSEYSYEIKSFYSDNTEPFNEFKMINNRQIVSAKITVGIDRKADGTLNEIVDDTMSLEKLQTLYAEIIQVGLKNNELIQVDSRILVKEK